MMKNYLLSTMLVASLLLAACATAAQPSPVVAPLVTPTKSEAPTPDGTSPVPATEAPVEALKNTTYSGILDQPITLKNGSANYEDGGSSLPYVILIDHLISIGDLNGDDVEDAAVMLVDNTTGSADFVYLVPILNILTNPTPLKALLIGDRTPVISLVIEDGKVVVEFLGPSPDDPACCPSMKTRKTFALENGGLTEQSREELGKISANDLNDTDWKLVNLNQDQEPVLAETEVSIHIDAGQVSGSGGCNNYNASLAASGNENLPQTFDIGPVVATKRACANPILNQENTYFTRLDAVTAWRYNFGYLSLTYKEGKDFGELVFAPQGNVGAFVPTGGEDNMQTILEANSWQ